jgi:hypothetical protein
MATAQDNHNYTTSQLLGFLPGSYPDRTSRPVYALVFILPLIVFYEIGSILISPEALSESLSRTQVRVVSFIWIQNLLEYLGFEGRMLWVATPFVVVIILLALQFASGTKWRVILLDLVYMGVECVLLSVPLIVLSLIFNRTVASQSGVLGGCFLQAASGGGGNELMVNIVTGIGAGIYEELVFRLILICLLMLIFQDFLQIGRKNSIIFSILISAALFSAHHHLFIVDGRFGFGEAFQFSRFFFRALAGVYFAVLFAVRGFGIAAGTHAFYDIIAAVLNASLFFEPGG